MTGALHAVLLLLGGLSGRVVDASGKPAAGAVVHLMSWRDESYPGDQPTSAVVALRAVTAGAAGEFRFEVEDGQIVGVWAEHGEALASLPTAPLLAGDVVELRLQPTVMLRGTVLTKVPGAKGATLPAAGAEVSGPYVPIRSREPGAAPDSHTRRRFQFTTRSDAGGGFALRALPGPQGIAVSARLAALRATVRAAPDAPGPLELLLRPTDGLGRWHARFVDRKTGASVAGAVACALNGTTILGVSDATGRIEVEPTSAEFVLFPRAHRWEWMDLHRFEPADQPEVPRLELDLGTSLSVRLLRPDGTAIARAPVAVFGSLPNPGRAGRQVYDGIEATDASGRLELGLPELRASVFVQVDGSWVLLLDARGNRPMPQGDVVVDTSARLAGQVLDPKGTPVGQARLLLLPAALSDQGWISFKAATRCVPVDKNGRFLVTGLRPGDFLAAVDAAGFLPAFATWTAGKDRASVTVSLQAGAELSGRIVSAEGNPVAGARLLVIAESQDEHWQRFGLGGFEASSDENGRFRIAGLPAGTQLTVDVKKLGGKGEILGATRARLQPEAGLELVLK